MHAAQSASAQQIAEDGAVIASLQKRVSELEGEFEQSRMGADANNNATLALHHKLHQRVASLEGECQHHQTLAASLGVDLEACGGELITCKGELEMSSSEVAAWVRAGEVWEEVRVAQEKTIADLEQAVIAAFEHAEMAAKGGGGGRKTSVEQENKEEDREEDKEALALALEARNEAERQLKEELKAELKVSREMLTTLTEQYARSHEQVGALTRDLEHVCEESVRTDERYGQRLAQLHTQIATLEDR